MVQNVLEKTHLQVALSLLAPAWVALVLLIQAPEMTLHHYLHQEEQFINSEAKKI
jgi:hypothetical protein